MENDKIISISLIDGCEGKSIYIDDTRVAGNKPWGGGKLIKKWNIRFSDIIYALRNIYNPASQPLKDPKDGLKDLYILATENTTCDHNVGFSYDAWNEAHKPIFKSDGVELGKEVDDFCFKFCPECGARL